VSLKTANVPIHVEVSIYLTLLGSDLAEQFG
jgi:hypothetical protein